MVDYEKLYKNLFNGITEAIDSLEKQNYGSARLDLIKLQQEAEDFYIQADEQIA